MLHLINYHHHMYMSNLETQSIIHLRSNPNPFHFNLNFSINITLINFQLSKHTESIHLRRGMRQTFEQSIWQ